MNRRALLASIPAVFIPSIAKSENLEVQSLELIEAPDAIRTSPRDINNRGYIIGYYEVGSSRRFGFTKKGDRLSSFSVPGAHSTWAWGIDDDNRIVGTWWDGTLTGNSQGFIYENRQFTTLNHGFSTEIYGIFDGKAVGSFNDGVLHGFIYEKGQFTPLDYPGAFATVAFGIDGDRIVGIYYEGNIFGPTHGFVYENGDYQEIKSPQDDLTYLHAVNNRSILGNTEDGPFLLTRNKFQLLDPGFAPVGINDHRTVVGRFGNLGFVACINSIIVGRRRPKLTSLNICDKLEMRIERKK